MSGFSNMVLSWMRIGLLIAAASTFGVSNVSANEINQFGCAPSLYNSSKTSLNGVHHAIDGGFAALCARPMGYFDLIIVNETESELLERIWINFGSNNRDLSLSVSTKQDPPFQVKELSSRYAAKSSLSHELYSRGFVDSEVKFLVSYGAETYTVIYLQYSLWNAIFIE